jgi:hypothetical protein
MRRREFIAGPGSAAAWPMAAGGQQGERMPTASPCLTHSTAGAPRLFTRRGFSWTERYPAIAATAAKLRARSFTLDGEATVSDAPPCRRDARSAGTHHA